MKTLVFLVLATVMVLSAADGNVSGKWSGSFSMTRPDGGSDGGDAFAVLKQENGRITGTAGPSETDQWTIEKATISGNQVTLEVTSPENGTKYKCDLTLEGDHLKGPVSVVQAGGQAAAGKLDLSRVK